MPRELYAGRHRAGRHRAPRRRPRRVARWAGSTTFVGLSVVALTAAAPSTGAGGDLVGLDRAAARATVPSLTARTEQDEARLERNQDLVASRDRLRQETAVRASRAKARRAAREQAALAAAHRWVRPLSIVALSSGYGPRWGRQHAGLDLAAPSGVRVSSVSSGVVVFAGYQGAYGNKVEIRHWDGTVTAYAHMSSITVTAGQSVVPGQQVGAVGSTGRSTGPHLHLEVRPGGGGAVDGSVWLRARGVDL